MKKLLISLMILCSFGLQAQQDVTGTWRSADGWKAEFIQDGIHVYAILNVSNFKHFIMATINGNQIRGTILRYDVNNNCNTAMDGTWTLSGNNSMQLTWKDLDGRCDLGLNQTGTDAPLTRVSRPSELPMNGFGGSRFDPNSDATGSWGDADWIQLGTLVYFINNNSGFKHYFMGSRNGNQITGTQTRINRSNGCLTEMNMTFTLTNANSMQYRAVARDGRCDLQLGWSESGTITRRGTNGTVPPAVQAGTYTLTNKNSNLCLAVRGATQNNGEEGTQWACDGNADKNWKIIDAGGGFYKLQNENSNHFLAVGAGSRDQGGRVVQYVDQGQEDILWRLIDIGDGYYKVQNKNSGLFLAIGAGSRDPGANLVQWGDAGQEDVKWKLDKLFIRPFPIDIGSLLYKMATVYPNPNFGGTGVDINTVGRKTLSEVGISSVGSIKVAWGYKAIVTYESAGKKGAINTNQMEIVGDRETLPTISGSGASAGRSSVTAIEIVAYTPLSGFVDMHTHPMSYLGFGRKALHGAPDIGCIIPSGTFRCNPTPFRATSIDQALGTCNSTHGGWGIDNGCGDYLRAGIINYALDADFEYKVGFERNPHGDHEQAGYPDLRFWPNHTSILHQQMWIDWLRRAHTGGLRVIVALTVNSEILAEILNGDPPYDDKSVADVQIDETVRFVNAHNDFMEIAYSKADLQRIVSNNKLAVVLGMEVDKIGNFGKPGVETNENTVRAEIQRLYHNKGIRYIFPIHLIDNSFGGTAVFKMLFNFANKYANGYHFRVETSRDPNVKYSANMTNGPIGLENGLIIGIRGFLEGLGRLPAPCMNDAFKCFPPPGKLSCCGSYQKVLNVLSPSADFDAYKFITAGHVNALGLSQLGEIAINEMMKLGMMIDIDHMSEKSTKRTIEIAKAVSGGYPLNMGHNGIRGENGNERGAPISMIRDGIAPLGGMFGVGAAHTNYSDFINNFRQVRTAMGNRSVAIGTDVNGFERLPERLDGKGNTENSNTFYQSFFEQSGIRTKCITGNRTWDYVQDGGVSHYGIMPEFLHEIKINGGTDVIGELNKSAEYFAQMWEKCERQKTSVR